MSTLEEFEGAPVGATATHPDGRQAVGTFDYVEGRWYATDYAWYTDGEMVRQGYVLDLVPAPAPTTVRGALDLAWELACPVKEGQTIPAGVIVLDGFDGRVREEYNYDDLDISKYNVGRFRTLDPLPDPEPDWLDAPAVKARVKGYPVLFTWIPVDGPRHHRWHSPVKGAGETFDWTELTDVTPLYPKEDA